jgi:hypothetical protein
MCLGQHVSSLTMTTGPPPTCGRAGRLQNLGHVRSFGLVVLGSRFKYADAIVGAQTDLSLRVVLVQVLVVEPEPLEGSDGPLDLRDADCRARNGS